MFRWILDSLLELDEINQVVINTDARRELKKCGLAESSRILIRDRKPELCGDLVSMNKILADDIANVEADVYIMTHTTNPLLSAYSIRKAIRAFQECRLQENIDSLFSVDKVQARFYRKDCSPVNHDPNNLMRTQDLEPWYEENSNLYIFTRESFSGTNARIGCRPMMFESQRIESIDIDTPQDWEFASAAADYLRARN